MEILQQKRALEVIYNIFACRPGKSKFVKTKPTKLPFPGKASDMQMLRRASPESQGVSSEALLSFFKTLTDDPKVNLHSIMILRHGAVIAEMSCKPYTSDIWHCTHSMCKTITGLAVGMMTDEGKMTCDAPLSDYLVEARNPNPFSRYNSITVDNLLTMSSGVSFAEAGTATDENWIKAFFESAVKFEPGSQFAYNSMNTYILSAIIQRLTGQTLTEYLEPRLFSPLGIKTYHWEKSPTGVVKGGWGLYLLPEDMAKIGLLILNRGKWNGEQLVSDGWINKMSERSFDTPAAMGKYGYARHAWCGARRGSINCNGLFGQNVIVYPDLDVVIVTTAAIDTLFQTCRMTDLIEAFFTEENMHSEPLPENDRLCALLRLFCNSSSEYVPLPNNKKSAADKLHLNRAAATGRVPDICRSLSGKTYRFDAANAGIIPLTCQIIQNNYDVGIQSMSFIYDDALDSFTIVMDHNGTPVRVPVGFGRAEYFDYDMNGEIYRLACIGEAAKNEDDIPVLKLRIPCLEASCERNIKIFIEHDGKITVRFAETPGKQMIIGAFEFALEPNLTNPLVNAIAAKTNGDYLLYRLDRAIEPTSVGREV